MNELITYYVNDTACQAGFGGPFGANYILEQGGFKNSDDYWLYSINSGETYSGNDLIYLSNDMMFTVHWKDVTMASEKVKPGQERYNRVQAKLGTMRMEYNRGQTIVDNIHYVLRKNRMKLDEIAPGVTQFLVEELNKIDARADRNMMKVEKASVPEMSWDMFIDENWFNMCCDMLNAQNSNIIGFETNILDFCKFHKIDVNSEN